jgi:phosphate transport system substrate-binding protein
MTQRTRRRGWLLGLTLAIALVATACGGDAAGGGTGGTSLSGSIVIDGSSTVAPVTEAIAEEFRKEQSGVEVTVGTSGTGGGFTKFCAGETDIQDASRAIDDEEKAACEAKGIKYQEFRIGLDGLAVVSSAQNQFLDTLNYEQLARSSRRAGPRPGTRSTPASPTRRSPSSRQAWTPAPTTSSSKRSG